MKRCGVSSDSRILCNLADDGSRVHRRKLALPEAYTAPRTATERRLTEIWCAVLNMDCIGIDDDYNDLGGDSYYAALIFALIEEAFGVDLPLARLVTAPTIAELARDIDVARQSPGDARLA
jgi:acyl carrier protein